MSTAKNKKTEDGKGDAALFIHTAPVVPLHKSRRQRRAIKHVLTDKNNQQRWKNIASKSILVFAIMIVGHIVISYLPFRPVKDIWEDIKPHFNLQLLLFVITGFVAQMVDGVLGMGYG